MTETGFNQFLSQKENKVKLLDRYEGFVKDRLIAAPAASTAQVLDCSSTVDAHEAAFAFFGGIVRVIVYDQDRLLLIDECLGKLLLTQEFKSYVQAQSFHLHFCRKSDPQSKGKVENVVKYVKHNFLYGRIYHDLETLQTEVLGWLQRTGNGMPHSVTRKIPLKEWEQEKVKH